MSCQDDLQTNQPDIAMPTSSTMRRSSDGMPRAYLKRVEGLVEKPRCVRTIFPQNPGYTWTSLCDADIIDGIL